MPMMPTTLPRPHGSRPDTRALAETLAAAPDGPALARALAGTDLEKLPAHDAGALARALAAAAGAPDVKIACLANFTLDLLPRCLDLHCAQEGLRSASYLGQYGQHVQEVLDPGSRLAGFAPDLVFLALSLRLLRPAPMAAFSSLSPADRRVLRREVADELEAWAAAALERLPATLLIANFVSPDRPAAGVADLNDPYGETELYLDLNLDLLRRFKGNPRVQVVDLDRVAARFGKERIADRKMVYLAKMEWGPAFLPAVAAELVRHVKAVQGRAKKCIVLDLDNTLWGGVVGEDGLAGVRIGPGDPEGEAFLDFHHRLKALQAQGVLLAVCSKNNPADVHELFAARPDLPVQLTDFAAVEIGWEPKHEGVRRIAAALSLGTDSLVFLDDNPAEVSLIAQMLPGVKTVLLPPDPADYTAVLDRLTDFERLQILEEDLNKTRQYRENRERESYQAAASDRGDLASYLVSLRTELTLHRAKRDDLPRVHQLFTKTNQFNLTTQRYSPAQIERFLAAPFTELWVARARDRFGDLGAIGAVLLRKDPRLVRIDSFLLSCRAMGRGLETAIMNHVKSRFLDDPTNLELRGRFLPTARNKPVETFLDDQGFRLIEHGDGGEDGEKLYALRRSEVKRKDCEWIRVQEEVGAGLRGSLS